MKAYDLYEAIFSSTQCVQMRNRKVDEDGVADYFLEEYSDWVTITTKDPVTGFIGSCVAGSYDLIADDTFRIIDAVSHDGTVVELQGKKYLLTEVKDI
jgi:hypothetical protein